MKWLATLVCALAMVTYAAGQTQNPNPPSTPDESASTATTNASASTTHEVDVPGSTQWTDTNIDLAPGESLSITVTGTLQYMDGTSPGPQGAARSWKDLLRSMPVNAAGRGALIGRIGSDDATQPFLVGAQFQVKVRIPGRLFLGINGPSGDSAQGNFHATIEISGAPASSASAASSQTSSTAAMSGSGSTAPTGGANLVNTSVDANGTSAATSPAASISASSTDTSTAASDEAIAATLPKDLFTQIPRRVTDKDGKVGDMVNFLLIGTEDQVKNVFQAAGWVQVDKDTSEAIVEGLIASLSKQAYVTMPMSQLYLFGRTQDYGFAHAEPIKVVMTRHHLRVWKSTLTVSGQTVWVGAATHDMGLERDQRNGGVTHHIDPNVDDERSFVERSLFESGYVTQRTHVLPPDPVQDAKTATGGGFHSSGQVLVMWLSN